MKAPHVLESNPLVALGLWPGGGSAGREGWFLVCTGLLGLRESCLDLVM